MKQFFILFLAANVAAGELFDMDAIRDPSTLEVEVLQDWHAADHPCSGEVERRKLERHHYRQ